MEQVPKIVRERLKAVAPAVDHPDADVLTAFSERSLPERERTVVLEHLSRCTDCRDIVALSLPEAEAFQRVPERSPRSWFAWPAMRWGFAAAGIIIVASFGFLQYRKHGESSLTAYRQSPPPVAQQEAERKAEPPQPTAQPSQPVARELSAGANELKTDNTKLMAKVETRDEVTALSVPATPSRVVQFNKKTLPHGPALVNQMQLNSNLQQQNSAEFQKSAVPAMLPPKQRDYTEQSIPQVTQSQSVVVAGAAPPVQAEQNPKLEVQSQSLDQQTMNGGLSDSRIDTPVSTGIGYTTRVKVAGRSTAGNASGAAVGLATQSTRWTISSSGSLQRSVDQGKTWQDINVYASAPAGANLMLAANAPAPAKESEDKHSEKDKIERSKSATIVFRAVSANGADVWAGGSSGLLYHSIDSGVHWARVIPSAAGVALTGEVLTVSFTDAQHGRVSTSTSELWITRDGGQTWGK